MDKFKEEEGGEMVEERPSENQEQHSENIAESEPQPEIKMTGGKLDFIFGLKWMRNNFISLSPDIYRWEYFVPLAQNCVKSIDYPLNYDKGLLSNTFI